MIIPKMPVIVYHRNSAQTTYIFISHMCHVIENQRDQVS